MAEPDFSIGYARVSTGSQTLETQVEALRAAGCRVVYQEKVSGRSTKNRPELAKAIAALPSGAVLKVTRLDRLGRDVRDLWQTVKEIEERGAQFSSLAEPWADSSSPAGHLLLMVMGWVAEFERRAIIERTGAGLARAKRNGKKLGRPRRFTAVQSAEAYRMSQEGKNPTDIGRVLGADRKTVQRELDRIRAQTTADRQGPLHAPTAHDDEPLPGIFVSGGPAKPPYSATAGKTRTRT